MPRLGDPQSLNRYAYCLNRPLNFTDPTGHYTDDELLGFGIYRGPNSLAGARDNPDTARWYYILRATQTGDTFSDLTSRFKGFTFLSQVAIEGQFNVHEGKLTIDTGDASYSVGSTSLTNLNNDGTTCIIFQPDLSKPDGTQINSLEQARGYVQKREYGDHTLDPDFYEIAAGFYAGIGGHVAAREDRYGNRYVSLNVGIGLGSAGWSFMQGTFIQDYTPDQGQLSAVSTGWGVSASLGYGIGGGVAAVDGPTPVQYGLMTKGGSVSIGYGWKYDTP